uniref:30S ribosomal protein S20 n=1 Tax=Chorda asiatica TaxID=1281577 RepID=UPI002E789F07|nr:30S ribosomal protein S20 [Chorda asiatica]WAM62194.1 30S ribosomal protein S20 [Chorda asiatica]
MANSRASKKRIKTNRRNRIINNSYRSLMKSSEKRHLDLIKKYKNITNNSPEDKTILRTSLASAISQIDKAAKKKIIHKNTAIRKKTSLFRRTFFIPNI